MSLEDWKEVVANGATVSTIIMFLVGIQVCLGFWKNKSTGESSCMTFLVGVAMTFVWTNYGRLVGDSTLEFVNGTGLILQTIYTFVFYGYASSKIKTGKKIFITLLFVVFVHLYIQHEEDIEKVQYTVGLLGASMSVAYCSAPLASIQHVFRTKSTEVLPYYLIVATILVTGQWTLYGHIIKDNFVKVPNLLGFTAAVFQFSLFYYFPDKNEDYRPIKMEI